MQTTQPFSPQALARLSLILSGVLFLTGCPDSKVEVHRVGSEMPQSQKKMKGVFYALPRTLVLVTVPIKRTDKLPGRYAKFARCFFPEEADRRIKSQATSFEIADEITFQSKGEPDPDQIFMVNTKAGWFQTKSLTMAYTDDGVLSSAKAETKDESLDYAVSAFKTLASIGGAIATQGAGSGWVNPNFRAIRGPEVKLTPDEYQKEATALKARSQARKCYNSYVTATAAKTRMAADLLKDGLEALKKAGGSTISYQDDDVKLAEKTASQATIENARAAELADQAFAEVPASRPNEGLGDSTDGTWLNPPNNLNSSQPSTVKRRGSRGKNKGSLARDDSNATKDAEAIQTPPDPLAEGKRHEQNSANKAAEVVGLPGKSGLSRQAKDRAWIIYEQAYRELPHLAASPDKDVAEALLKSTKEALEATEAVIGEAQEISQDASGVEFGDTFKAAYYEAIPFAERIFSLQARREAILTDDSGDMPKEALELKLKEIDTTISTYKQVYFLGAKKSDTWSATFQYLPPSSLAESSDPCHGKPGESDPKCEIEAPLALFKFSKVGGVCGGGVLSAQGIKINSDFQIQTKCATSEPVSISIAKIRNTNGVERQVGDVVKGAEFTEGNGTRTTENRGFYYRIPARARLILSVGAAGAPGTEIKRTILPIAQMGVIASLPVSTGGRRTSYNITLDPSTGALRNFELGSDAAIQKSMLDDAQSGVKSIIDAQDPLLRLKRRKEFLETLKAVKTAEKELKEADNNTNNNSNNNTP